MTVFDSSAAVGLAYYSSGIVTGAKRTARYGHILHRGIFGKHNQACPA